MDYAAIHLQRLSRARATFRDGDDFLLDVAVSDMVERLSAVNRSFQNAAALFGRTPKLAQRLRELKTVADVFRVEESVYTGEADAISSPDRLNLPKESFDLIVAPFSLHWAQDLPGSLVQINQALRPDGLLLASLPGPETLSELRISLLQAESETVGGAAVRVDAFTDIRDAGALLQRGGFALPVVDQDTVTVRYDTMFDLAGDLRHFGATSRQLSVRISRETAIRASEIYAHRFSDSDGRVRASFSFVSMSGWKPHESQQKPLRPGSAAISLADALRPNDVPLKR